MHILKFCFCLLNLLLIGVLDRVPASFAHFIKEIRLNLVFLVEDTEKKIPKLGAGAFICGQVIIFGDLLLRIQGIVEHFLIVILGRYHCGSFLSAGRTFSMDVFRLIQLIQQRGVMVLMLGGNLLAFNF